MSAVAYTYSVVQYAHDPSAGEKLNIGVILYSPEVPFLDLRVEHRYQRLSEAFAGFDGEHYRRALRSFEAAVSRARAEVDPEQPQLWQTRPADVEAILARVWPDRDLSFQPGPILGGIAEDPALALDAIFERMVSSQYPHSEALSRSDQEVWDEYRRPLSRESVLSALRPVTITTPEIDLDFDHGYKNERWHVLQPVSMDAKRAETLQNRAVRWLGRGVALEGNEELGRLYLLLGAPRQEEHRRAYRRAVDLLRKMPSRCELVEEDEADDFAKRLADEMRRHGVLSP